MFPIREGVRGGAGWATAPPKIILTKGKNLYFRKYTKKFSNIRLTSPDQKKIPNALPVYIVIMKFKVPEQRKTQR